MVRSISLILVLFFSVSGFAQKSRDQIRFEKNKKFGLMWKQKDYKITVETDFEYLQKGQYLFIVSDMGDTKMDLPESWKIKKAYATDSTFVIELSGNKRFEASRYFMSKLDTEILGLPPQIGLPNEADLVAIWGKYNGKI